MACYTGNQAHLCVHINNLSISLVEWEASCLHQTPNSFDCASCSFGPVLNEASLCALWYSGSVYNPQGEARGPNTVLEWSSESWATRRDYVILCLWTCERNAVHHMNPITSWKWLMPQISQSNLNCSRASFGSKPSNHSVSVNSQTAKINMRYQHKVRGKCWLCSIGKGHEASVYLMSSVWVPSSPATEKCWKSQRLTQTEEERKKPERPKLGLQKLPTKAFTKRHNPKWEAVKWPGGGRQQHLPRVTAAVWPAI